MACVLVVVVGFIVVVVDAIDVDILVVVGLDVVVVGLVVVVGFVVVFVDAVGVADGKASFNFITMSPRQHSEIR